MSETSYSYCSEFFVFNSTLSKREDDEDNKILFYHPLTTAQATKHRQIGLCEGVIHFAEPFSDKPLESIHTEKRASFLYNPEPDLWFVMVMENPRGPDPASAAASGSSSPAPPAAAAAASSSSSSAPSTTNTPPASASGTSTPSPSGSGSRLPAPVTPVLGAADEEPYREAHWSDECMLVVLSTVYKMFRLFHGPVSRLVGKDGRGREAAVTALRSFLPSIIMNMEWDRVDLFTTLAGVHFLPVDKNVYLQVQKFVNTTEDAFAAIRNTSCMYRDHLIWSGLEQDDIRTLYKVIVSHMYEETSDIPPYLSSVRSRLRSKLRFVTGPEDPSKPDGPSHPLQVFIGPDSERHELLIYQIQELTCMFLLKGPIPPGFYQLLDAHITRQVSDTLLTAIIAEHYQRKTAFDDQYRYIYFNQMNLALKTSLRSKGMELNAATMAILNRMHEEFEQSVEGVCEVLVRTANDRWVVGRRSEQREFYIIFDNSKSANLIEINEEVKKLSSQYFQSIFITE